MALSLDNSAVTPLISVYKPSSYCFFYALLKNMQEDVVNFLLDQKCNPDLISGILETPLHQACERGELDMCRLLVRRGANLEARNFQERTPLFEAAISIAKEERALDIVKFLRDSGAELGPVDAGTNCHL